MTSDDLGSVVLEAVHTAQGLRLELWARAIEQAMTTAKRPAETPSPTPTTGPVPDLLLLTDELTDELNTVLNQLDQLDPPNPAVLDASAEDNGRIRVRLGPDGEPIAVEINARWASGLSTTGLGERILEAFRSAYEDFEARREETPDVSAAMSLVARDPVGVWLRYVEGLSAGQ